MPRIEIFGPIASHPGLDQLAVGWMLAAKHQIDLQRFVEEAGIANLAVKLLLQTKEQTRTEQPFQSDAICVLGGRLQAFALAKTEPGGQWRRQVGGAAYPAGMSRSSFRSGSTLCEIVVADKRLFCVRTCVGKIFVIG